MSEKPIKLERKWKHYGLRTSGPDRRSHGGFQWPETGVVECPDWNPKAECGNGLHALLSGEGDASLLNWADDATWQMVGFDEYVYLSGKVKFPRCEVATGSRLAVTDALIKLTNAAVHAGTATAGYAGTATAGNRGTATAGDAGIILIKWWDGKRYRFAEGYVGENGIEPNKPYRVVGGKLVLAT